MLLKPDSDARVVTTGSMALMVLVAGCILWCLGTGATLGLPRWDYWLVLMVGGFETVPIALATIALTRPQDERFAWLQEGLTGLYVALGVAGLVIALVIVNLFMVADGETAWCAQFPGESPTDPTGCAYYQHADAVLSAGFVASIVVTILNVGVLVVSRRFRSADREAY